MPEMSVICGVATSRGLIKLVIRGDASSSPRDVADIPGGVGLGELEMGML